MMCAAAKASVHAGGHMPQAGGARNPWLDHCQRLLKILPMNSKQAAADARKRRLAQALKENIARRKQAPAAGPETRSDDDSDAESGESSAQD